jgi:hypothetical protein
LDSKRRCRSRCSLGTCTTTTEFHFFFFSKVVLVVASIPMAIEIVTTTTLALGSKVSIYIWKSHFFNHFYIIYIWNYKRPHTPSLYIPFSSNFEMNSFSSALWNFHVLNNLLLIYICKLHWNTPCAVFFLWVGT